MRIGWIGDVHIGASLTQGKKDLHANMNTRMVDYHQTLLYTMRSLRDEGCTQLIFTGDIFEHRIPTMKQQELFSEALNYAIELGFDNVHIDTGNHDQQRAVNATTLCYIKELPIPNIHIYDEMSRFTLKDSDGNIEANLLFMPFRDKRWLKAETNAEAIDMIESALNALLKEIDNDAPIILTGHMTIEGTLWMLEKYVDLYDGQDLILPISMFNSIDITIMGHVHTPGRISESPFIAYTGSMEKRGPSEDHDKKFWIVDTVTKKVIEFVEPCRNIFEVEFFKEEPCGDSIMSEIFNEIDNYFVSKEVRDSIVRLSITVAASDDKFIEVKKLEKYMYDVHNVFHCVKVKPKLIFSRQGRDETINEHASDTISFKTYVQNEFETHDNKEKILAMGLDIIRSIGDNE